MRPGSKVWPQLLSRQEEEVLNYIAIGARDKRYASSQQHVQ